VGADRKGPLAAFIVVAIIAAILLITSVRSQAATGWLGRALPSTPEVVRAVGGGLDRAVEQGSVLVRGATDPVSTSDSHDADAPAPRSPSPSTDQPATSPATHPASQPPTVTTTQPAPSPHAVRHHVREDVEGPGSPGRHLGRTHPNHGHVDGHGHGHGRHPHPGHAHPDHASAGQGQPDHGLHLGRRLQRRG
jgi:hypothetical protein